MAIGITSLFGPDGYRRARGDPRRQLEPKKSLRLLEGFCNPPTLEASADAIKDRQRPDSHRDTLPGVSLVPSALAVPMAIGITSLFGPDGYRQARGDLRRQLEPKKKPSIARRLFLIKDRQRPDSHRDTLPGVIPSTISDGYRDNFSVRSRWLSPGKR